MIHLHVRHQPSRGGSSGVGPSLRWDDNGFWLESDVVDVDGIEARGILTNQNMRKCDDEDKEFTARRFLLPTRQGHRTLRADP